MLLFLAWMLVLTELHFILFHNIRLIIIINIIKFWVKKLSLSTEQEEISFFNLIL
jgi:hypothetical protein